MIFYFYGKFVARFLENNRDIQSFNWNCVWIFSEIGVELIQAKLVFGA